MFSCECCEIFKIFLFTQQLWTNASVIPLYHFHPFKPFICPFAPKMPTSHFNLRLFLRSNWWEEVVRKCPHCTKMKFSINDFFSKCDQIHSFLRIWSHLLKKSLTENSIFCVVPAEKSCSNKFQKIHRKTPVPESPFSLKLQADQFFYWPRLGDCFFIARFFTPKSCLLDFKTQKKPVEVFYR